jgi:hypothetical protein
MFSQGYFSRGFFPAAYWPFNVSVVPVVPPPVPKYVARRLVPAAAPVRRSLSTSPASSSRKLKVFDPAVDSK